MAIAPKTLSKRSDPPGGLNALPAPFPGFQAQGGTKVQPIGKVSPGTEKNPMQLYYSVTWTNPALAAQESRQKDEATARAFAKLKGSPIPAQQKALFGKQQKLAAEYAKALQAHDQARTAQAKKDLDGATAELAKLNQATDEILKEATAVSPQKSRLGIRMAVNVFGEAQATQSIRDFKPASGDLGFTYHDPAGRAEDSLTVLAGRWGKAANSSMTNYMAVPNPKVPYTSAQAVKVTVTGDAALAAKLIGAINWTALHSQLGR